VPMSVAESLSTYLFDPSPSLVAARLVGALGEAVELSALSTQSLYLTGMSQVIHPHLQTFVVQDELPLDIRKLRAYFQARGIGRLEIKKRGVELTPESLRPQLALSGDYAATLILSCVGTSIRAIVCQRV
jgi:hypothetical protein